jgi:hypothetical protein
MKPHLTLLNTFRLFVIFCLLLPAVALPAYGPQIAQAKSSFIDELPPSPETTPDPEETKTPDPIPTPEVTETPLPLPTQPADDLSGQSVTTALNLPDEEYQALLALYDSANGDAWTNKDEWKSDASPCTWYGVTCEEGTTSLHVVGLDLASNNLSGSLPAALADLTQLKTFKLRSNLLSGMLPDLSALVHLQVIDLGFNGFAGALPEWIEQLEVLEELYLNDNQFTGALSDPFGEGLAMLLVLDLSNNLFEGPLPVFSSMPSLKVLNLSGNGFTSTVPPSLGQLSELTELRLGSNGLVYPLPDELAGLQKLEKLHLDKNDFKGALPAWIVDFPALIELKLAKNGFDGPLPANIGNLGKTLITLDIAHNHFWGEIPVSITKLTRLNRSGGYTDIGHNHLTSKNTTVRDFLAKKNPGWSKTQTPVNPLPVIQGINPPFTQTRDTVMVIEVRGKNMMEGAQVYWNGVELDTGFINAWTLEVRVPGDLLTEEGTAVLTAKNPYPTTGLGAEFNFYISNLVPAPGSTVLSRRPQFKWSEVPGADQYQLQLSTSKTFGTLLMTLTSPSAEVVLSRSLPVNANIYWRVRGRVDGVYQVWSQTYHFKSPKSPSTPVMVSPSNNAVTKTYRPKLSWEASSLSTGTSFEMYELQIATDPGFSQLVLQHYISRRTTRSYVVDKDPLNPDAMLLKPNTRYFWRVRAFNTLNQVSDWSAVRSIRAVMLPPVLIDPAQGTSSQSLRPTLIWAPVFEENTPPPVSYQLQISLTSNFSTIWARVSSKESQFTLTKTLPKNRMVYWRVRAMNANGTSYWVKGSFLSANPPSTPLPLSPAADALLMDYNPTTLTWSVSTLPTKTTFKHYILQISQDKSFPPAPLTVEYPITDISAPAWTLMDLAPNTRYYWRVQALNTEDHRSLWSTVRSFRTVMLPVTELAVLNEFSLRPTFIWDPPVIHGSGPAPTSYTIQFSLNASFNTLITSASLAGTSYVPSVDLPAGKNIHWRVRANGEFGPTRWETSSFKSATPPSVPIPQSPPNDFLSTDYRPTLVWSESVLQTGVILKHYRLQVSTSQTFSPIFITREVTNGNSYTFSAGELNPNTRYYWRVQAESTVGHLSGWSTVRNFRAALKPPVLLEPADGTTVTTRRPDFKWQMDSYTGVTSYTFQLATDTAFTNLLINTSVNSTSYTATVDLPTSRKIYWRVRANGANGPSDWSARMFTSANPPTTPSLVSPANGVVLKTNPTKLDWTTSNVKGGASFSHYEVEIATNTSFTSPRQYSVGAGNRKLSEMPWPALSAKTKYYWRVRAVATNGHMSAWSSVWSFTTP